MRSFGKITPLTKEHIQSKREIRNQEVKREVEEAASADPLDSTPRQDVSKELGRQKLLTFISDGNWKSGKWQLTIYA